MLLYRIGKIEEETQLSDLDQLEDALERDIAAQVNNDNLPQPQIVSAFFQPAPYRAAYSSFMGAKPRSRFVQQPSSFFPGQPSGEQGKAFGASQPLMPLSYFQKRARLNAPANENTGAPYASKFLAPAAQKRSLARMTVEALVSLGAVPLRMLIELGRFRYAKQRKFNSRLRLEKALGEGHEDGEQFLRHNPGAVRKKESGMTAGL